MIIRELGLIEYQKIFDKMVLFTESRDDSTEDELWVLEHNPVFTLGKAGKVEHLLVQEKNIPLIQSDRGGQVTYHGPGQLVIYTLIDFAKKNISVRELVTRIESSIIQMLKDYGIESSSNLQRPGVYVGEKKIASIGLRIRKKSVYHGLSVNVDMDLKPFSYINPCGYAGLEMIQMRDLLEQCPNIKEVSEKLVTYLQVTL